MTDSERIHEDVRARYAEAALSVLDPSAPGSVALASNRVDASASCCGPSAGPDACCSSPAGGGAFGADLYTDDDRSSIPDAVALASL
ncbi:MAG: hypothetical protein M3P84_05795, partial [Chloroflexota bacterium]|nr:hypothetical protein [Chloroflexota bacterium]